MMVSVSIFAIVVMISMTAILSVVDSSKKAQSMKSVMNNLNFALETMTRTIKTGKGYTVSGTGNTRIILTDQDGASVSYYLDGTTIMRSGDPITAPEVDVDKLQFIDGTGNSPKTQPSVIMIIHGTVKLSERVTSEFSVQTTVTQRLPGI